MTPQPGWRRIAIPARRDVRLLLGAGTPRQHQFETLREAQTLTVSRIEVLAARGSSLGDLASDCDAASPCNRPICAICTRDYRIYIASELLRIALSCPGSHEFATIFLESVGAGALPDVDMKKAHAMLRKRLDRSGFRGAILIGGTEASWIARDRRWIVHAHLLAIGARPSEWRRLRECSADLPSSSDLKVEKLKDTARPLSYLTKFVTYHRPTRRGPHGRPAPAYPLPAARLIELAAWWAKYRFEDFGFLFGARRRGGRIVVEA
jgi:hypothetical protein